MAKTMSNEILLAIIGLVGTVGTAVFAVVKLVVPRLVENKVAEQQHELKREAFREDKLFDFIDAALETLRHNFTLQQEQNDKIIERLDMINGSVHQVEKAVTAQSRAMRRFIRQEIEG